MVMLERRESNDRLTSRALMDMDEAEFQRWVILLEKRTGMSMPIARKSFLVTSVALRMKELGFEHFDAYYTYLTSGLQGNVEWMALVDRLTVHETRFFRDMNALRVVVKRVLPAILERPDWGGDINVWSVGCSTGEEVYTLAMLLDHFAHSQSVKVRFGITGTDISLHSLATGREAIYSDRRAGQISMAFRAAYCEPVGPGRFRVVESLRKRVAFAQMNVLDIDQAAPRQMDVIYCQNMLIYFARPRREEILNGLVRHLCPGGYLVLGSGEIATWNNPMVERMKNPNGVLIFRRRIEPDGFV